MVEKIDSQIVKWAVGGLLSFISAVGLVWISRIQAQVDLLIPKLSAVEARESALAQRLDRIEHKVDLLLGRRDTSARGNNHKTRDEA